VRRNFQGYTSDGASVLLGIGASAIGHLPQGYVQNATATRDYIGRIRACGLATAKGIELSVDDRVRAYVIERLMWDGSFSHSDVERRFGPAAGPVLSDAELLIQSDRDGLVTATADGFTVTEIGRPLVRTICACFDTHLGTEGIRYSLGV
jgi:oxygen-independent coproporphyrinogen-3 oxidase